MHTSWPSRDFSSPVMTDVRRKTLHVVSGLVCGCSDSWQTTDNRQQIDCASRGGVSSFSTRQNSTTQWQQRYLLNSMGVFYYVLLLLDYYMLPPNSTEFFCTAFTCLAPRYRYPPLAFLRHAIRHKTPQRPRAISDTWLTEQHPSSPVIVMLKKAVCELKVPELIISRK